jgi:hypothetical protein
MRLVECDIQIKISVFITICQSGYQFEVLYTALRTGIEIYIAFNTAIFPVILILQVGTVTITEYKGPELGTIALLSNITREIITLLFAPLLVRWFGNLAPISAGGATTMDTTLPIITRYSGQSFVVVSIFHGFVVDFSVPFLVTLFCSI